MKGVLDYFRMFLWLHVSNLTDGAKALGCDAKGI